MKDKQKLLNQQPELLLDVLNQQRHDLLNHFQVLLGYLKLGKPEEGEAYLKRVTEKIQQESEIARLRCPLLSVFFLTFPALHHEMRLEVEVEHQLDLRKLAVDLRAFSQFVIDVVLGVKSLLMEEQGDQPSMSVSLSSAAHVIEVRFDLVGRLAESSRTQLDTLVKSGEKLGGTVTKCLHTEEDWILEMQFPYGLQGG